MRDVLHDKSGVSSVDLEPQGVAVLVADVFGGKR
jgi:hypothetical protein